MEESQPRPRSRATKLTSFISPSPPTSMSAPNASLRAAWHAVASAWPRDPLRPKLQFADAIRTAADRAFAASELTETQRWKANEAVRAMQRLVQNKALEQVSHQRSQLTPDRSRTPKAHQLPTHTHTYSTPSRSGRPNPLHSRNTTSASPTRSSAQSEERSSSSLDGSSESSASLSALPFFALVVPSNHLFLCSAMTTCIGTLSSRIDLPPWLMRKLVLSLSSPSPSSRSKACSIRLVESRANLGLLALQREN